MDNLEGDSRSSASPTPIRVREASQPLVPIEEGSSTGGWGRCYQPAPLEARSGDEEEASGSEEEGLEYPSPKTDKSIDLMANQDAEEEQEEPLPRPGIGKWTEEKLDEVASLVELAFRLSLRGERGYRQLRKWVLSPAVPTRLDNVFDEPSCTHEWERYQAGCQGDCMTRGEVCPEWLLWRGQDRPPIVVSQHQAEDDSIQTMQVIDDGLGDWDS